MSLLSSTVSVVTALRLGRWGFDFRQTYICLSFLQGPGRLWGSPSLLSKIHRRFLCSIPCINTNLINLCNTKKCNCKSIYNLVRVHITIMVIYTLSLTSALDGGGLSSPRPGRFNPGKRPGTHSIGYRLGPRADLGGCGKSRHHRHSIPGPSSP